MCGRCVGSVCAVWAVWAVCGRCVGDVWAVCEMCGRCVGGVGGVWAMCGRCVRCVGGVWAVCLPTPLGDGSQLARCGQRVLPVSGMGCSALGALGRFRWILLGGCCCPTLWPKRVQ